MNVGGLTFLHQFPKTYSVYSIGNVKLINAVYRKCYQIGLEGDWVKFNKWKMIDK